jgi:hypothetical protein
VIEAALLELLGEGKEESNLGGDDELFGPI